ncbi:hypothetical protein K501DRAFT_276807 [Backusella circina FSU 941]|nr:hypothetical protein K501DRAFT_276807 [Backusella circina FSU 941]
MDRMPGEILLEIFLLLHQTDKVECMRVCKKWEYSIREFCLLHTLCISSQRQMKKLIQIFKNEPHKRELVDRVFVFSRRNVLPFVTPLLSYFPNPREVCLPTLALNEQDAKSETYQRWSSHVKHLTEYYSLKMTTKILGYHVFSRLETLSVYNDGRGYDRLPELVEVLSNAPVLKELRLNHFEFTIDSLEALHAAAPSLESIYCNEATILIMEHEPKIPSAMNIQPASLMKSFTFSMRLMYNIEHAAYFFEYVGIKYPNLEELGLTNLYYYTSINQKQEIYSDALTPLCQKLGPQLKKLTTFVPGSIQDMFKWMDDSTCRVKELDIEMSSYTVDDFKNSKQPVYIEKLTLRDIICNNFSWLVQCTALTELRLSFNLPNNNNHHPRRKMKLDSLLKVCPNTVTTLLLANIEIHYDKTTTIQLPAMRNLYFRRVEFTDGLDQFIAKAFPQLLVLKFHFCNLSYKTLVFPGLCLFRLKIDDIFTKKKMPTETLLVKTTNNNDSRLYKKMRFKVGEASMGVRYTKYDKSIYPENKLMNRDKFDKDPLITFECASVKNIMY